MDKNDFLKAQITKLENLLRDEKQNTQELEVQDRLIKAEHDKLEIEYEELNK